MSGLEVYRATAAHSAAHLVYTREPISAEALNPLQMAVISVIEDARVETLAIRAFPGLRQLWAKLHTAQADQAGTVGDYLNRLARALLDERVTRIMMRGSPRGVRCLRRARSACPDNTISWEIGVALAHGLLQKQIAFNPRTDVLTRALSR